MVLRGLHIARHNLWLHTGFWITWVVFFTFLQSLGQGSSLLLMWLWYYLITLPVFVAHTYIIAYWLVPSAFLKRRYGWFVAGLILLLVVFSILELVLSNEIIFKRVNPLMTAGDGYLNPGNIIISGIGNHYIILVFMSIKVGMAWYRARATEEEEKQRNLETTIETYNYHFRPKVLYHLMVLLGCAIQKDIKKSSELIILVSGFLNEFLNEINKQPNNLLNEIKQLEMYLNIFSAALPGQVKTELTAEGNFESFPVPGYLFLPVVDYALSLGKWCNNSCSCSVFIREESMRLHFNMFLSSENKIEQQDNLDSVMLSKQLYERFADKVYLKEEKGDTFWNFEADVFC